MPTEAEELQAKEFLKRAEVRTMRKDLLELRESDALKERDKIAKLRTLEEQLEELKKKNQASIAEKTSAQNEKFDREEVLQKNEGQERVAEKDLKNYATEQERQQIFLIESQRLALEKQIDVIDKTKDPELKLEKNKLLLQKRDWETKLNSILESQKKLDDEQKTIIEKIQTTTIPAQRKGLEQRRSELDKEIQDIEKTRWAAEKGIEDIDNKVGQINKSSDQLVTEKNGLRDKVLGADKSLRDIYSVVMLREEEKRRGEAQEQVSKREALSKVRAEEKENVRREQWSGLSVKRRDEEKEGGYLSKAPDAVKKRLAESLKAEEEQRARFLHDIDSLSQDENYLKKENLLSPVQKAQAIPQDPLAPPAPPIPNKK